MRSAALALLAGAGALLSDRSLFRGIGSAEQMKSKGHVPMQSGPIWMRWARRMSRMTQKEHQADRDARSRARELGPKFFRMTRQQRFHSAFAMGIIYMTTAEGEHERT